MATKQEPGISGIEAGAATLDQPSAVTAADHSRRRGARGIVAIGDSLVRRSLGLADILASVASFALAAAVSGGDLRIVTLAAISLGLIASAKLLGLYDRDAYLLNKNTVDEFPKVAVLATTVAFVALLCGDALTEPALTRAGGLVLWASLVLLILFARSLTRRLLPLVLPHERCLLIGDDETARSIAIHLAATPGVRADLIGSIDLGEIGEMEGAAYAQSVVQRARDHAADRVIIAAQLANAEEVVAAVRRLNQDGLKVSVAPGPGHLTSAAVEMDWVGGTALLGVHGFELTLTSRIVKRGFDLLASGACLLVLSPIYLVAAIAIRLEGPGPILFRQRRAGRDGRHFEMLKFRSMVEGADEQREGLLEHNQAPGLFKLASDPRVTRVGRVIRRHSIDELPQLLNVVRGEMSLVGPRPLPVAEDQRITGWQRLRLNDVRPGMTGPWQVLGGVARVPVDDMVRLDVQYVSGWSIWTDIRLLLLTLGHVARRRGY